MLLFAYRTSFSKVFCLWLTAHTHTFIKHNHKTLRFVEVDWLCGLAFGTSLTRGCVRRKDDVVWTFVHNHDLTILVAKKKKTSIKEIYISNFIRDRLRAQLYAETTSKSGDGFTFLPSYLAQFWPYHVGVSTIFAECFKRNYTR